MKTFNKVREDSLLEVLKASDPTGKWIHDFVHSDNPKFAGKSKKERIRMALGAAYGAKRANEEVEQIDEGGMPSSVIKSKQRYNQMTPSEFANAHRDKSDDELRSMAWRHGHGKNSNHYIDKRNKGLKEEVEQIDELSKGTLGSYVKGAARDVGASRKLATDFEHSAKSAKKQSAKDANKRLADKFKATAMKRNAGIGKAVERLTKEGVSENMSELDAKKLLAQHGATNFKTTSNELHFYKHGKHHSVGFIHNADSTRSVRTSHINAARRALTGQGVAEGAFSSGALKPTKEFEKQAAKVPSTGTVRGKDSKGVYTAKTVNGKEVSRVYENKLADRETDFDFHPTLTNKKKEDDDKMVPVHVIKPQKSFADLRKKNKEQDTHNMDEAYPSYTGDRADKLLKHSGDLYAKSTTETDPAKKTSLVAQSNKAHKVAMKAKAQHHKRNPEEVQAYVSHAMKPPKGWTND